MTTNSPMLAGAYLNSLLAWADTEADRLVDMYMGAAFQDKYVGGTTKPNELEEMDMLQAELPQLQQTLAMPPDPQIEARRQQAQWKVQRLIHLRLKHAAPEAIYGNP